MKTSVLFTIDVELAELLKKEKNKSALINSYLKDFYAEQLKNNEKQNNLSAG
jgi:hypothetical protein